MESSARDNDNDYDSSCTICGYISSIVSRGTSFCICRRWILYFRVDIASFLLKRGADFDFDFPIEKYCMATWLLSICPVFVLGSDTRNLILGLLNDKFTIQSLPWKLAHPLYSEGRNMKRCRERRHCKDSLYATDACQLRFALWNATKGTQTSYKRTRAKIAGQPYLCVPYASFWP
jgi:hypothetical protein